MPANKRILVEKVTDPLRLEKVFTIRTRVFVEEQYCIPELEKGHELESVHFLAMADLESAGAARWRPTTTGHKLERICVLPEFRGLGIANLLISKMLDDLPADADHYRQRDFMSVSDLLRWALLLKKPVSCTAKWKNPVSDDRSK